MRFGFFDQLPCAPGYSEQQRYHDIIAQKAPTSIS
jgi:hypothetical protein